MKDITRITRVYYFENCEAYRVSCEKLQTYSQHHDIVVMPSQKAVATKMNIHKYALLT